MSRNQKMRGDCDRRCQDYHTLFLLLPCLPLLSKFEVSFMVLYGFLKIPKFAVGDAKITVRSSFSCPVSHFFRNFEVSFMILYGLLEISKTKIGVAKITVRSSFSCHVSHLFRNFEVSFMVIYGFLKISKISVGDAQDYSTLFPSPALSPTSFEILRCRSWYSMASGNLQGCNRRCQDYRTLLLLLPCLPLLSKF